MKRTSREAVADLGMGKNAGVARGVGTIYGTARLL
jgi:hypothetical protein